MDETKMTHEQYLQKVGSAAVDLARQMLANQIDLVEGCRKIHGLLFELGADALDEELSIFKVVDSDADDLPIGVAPELLDPDYRETSEKKSKDLAEFYKDTSEKVVRSSNAGMRMPNSRLQRTPDAQARLGADEPQGRSTDLERGRWARRESVG